MNMNIFQAGFIIYTFIIIIQVYNQVENNCTLKMYWIHLTYWTP